MEGLSGCLGLCDADPDTADMLHASKVASISSRAYDHGPALLEAQKGTWKSVWSPRRSVIVP